VLKASRILCVPTLAGFAATVAMADGVDPTVVIRRVDPPPIAITSPDQTFNILATFANVNGIETAAFAWANGECQGNRVSAAESGNKRSRPRARDEICAKVWTGKGKVNR